jgi:hypothetical protein
MKKKIIIFFVLTGLVQASVNYIGSFGGNWNNANNWSTGQLPGEEDNVCITGEP